MTKKILLVFLLCFTVNFSFLSGMEGQKEQQKDQKDSNYTSLICSILWGAVGYAVGSCINNNDTLIPISKDTQEVLPISFAVLGATAGGALPHLLKQKKD